MKAKTQQKPHVQRTLEKLAKLDSFKQKQFQKKGRRAYFDGVTLTDEQINEYVSSELIHLVQDMLLELKEKDSSLNKEIAELDIAITELYESRYTRFFAKLDASVSEQRAKIKQAGAAAISKLERLDQRRKDLLRDEEGTQHSGSLLVACITILVTAVLEFLLSLETIRNLGFDDSVVYSLCIILPLIIGIASLTLGIAITRKHLGLGVAGVVSGFCAIGLLHYFRILGVPTESSTENAIAYAGIRIVDDVTSQFASAPPITITILNIVIFGMAALIEVLPSLMIDKKQKKETKLDQIMRESDIAAQDIIQSKQQLDALDKDNEIQANDQAIREKTMQQERQLSAAQESGVIQEDIKSVTEAFGGLITQGVSAYKTGFNDAQTDDKMTARSWQQWFTVILCMLALPMSSCTSNDSKISSTAYTLGLDISGTMNDGRTTEQIVDAYLKRILIDDLQIIQGGKIQETWAAIDIRIVIIGGRSIADVSQISLPEISSFMNRNKKKRHMQTKRFIEALSEAIEEAISQPKAGKTHIYEIMNPELILLAESNAQVKFFTLVSDARQDSYQLDFKTYQKPRLRLLKNKNEIFQRIEKIAPITQDLSDIQFSLVTLDYNTEYDAIINESTTIMQEYLATKKLTNFNLQRSL